MKKLDKLILKEYLGPFLITFLVVVFILLNIQMIKYFDDVFGKGLDGLVIAQFFFYFAVYTTPTALPLAVLLSSLITYGNLGEHFELTAIKGSGISLLRTLLPIFIFILGLTVFSYYFNNNWQPRAALEAYSLLFDIKQKKPAMDIREGIFYYGIPDISIKVNERLEDGITLKDIIIYDHRRNDGNKEVTIADSGKMYTILNERYLKFELFNGVNYQEGMSESEMVGQRRNRNSETLSRSRFDKSQMVFDLSSFSSLQRTDKQLFKNNRIMRNMSELDKDLDSIHNEILRLRLESFMNRGSFFAYFERPDSIILPQELYAYKVRRDSLAKAKAKIVSASDSSRKPLLTKVGDKPPEIAPKEVQSEKMTRLNQRKLERRLADSVKSAEKQSATRSMEAAKESATSGDTSRVVSKVDVQSKLDSLRKQVISNEIVQDAANRARQARSQVMISQTGLNGSEYEYKVFHIQWHKIIANSLMCVVMFLIGAPLGSIIKRGGLGVPFLVSIFFFIIYYVISIQGEKFAKQGHISVITGVWLPDVVLLIVGLIFLRQARIDARLFDSDAYLIFFDRAGKLLRIALGSV
jgi:lipopolysaccharide export system permease protein